MPIDFSVRVENSSKDKMGKNKEVGWQIRGPHGRIEIVLFISSLVIILPTEGILHGIKSCENATVNHVRKLGWIENNDHDCYGWMLIILNKG